MKTKTVRIIDQGIVFRQPDQIFGYYGWPSVAINSAGEIVVACSGNRALHVCPFGKVLLRKSHDEGKNWSAPIIAIDSPLDDRDAGILNLGDGKMIVSSFNNNRELQEFYLQKVFLNNKKATLTQAYLSLITDEIEDKYLGSLMSYSEDNGESWSEPYKVPVSAPHGPNVLHDGSLIYAGSPFEGAESPMVKPMADQPNYPIAVYKSENHRDFAKLADIPPCPELGRIGFEYTEPHIVELKSGRLVLHIRVDDVRSCCEAGINSIVQSISDDGGHSWSVPKLLGNKNFPPHLLLHSSGTLICTYGHREPPFGIQAMLSHNEAETWDMGYDIWDQGVDGDLGYPCSVELKNGDLFTVYYGKVPGDTMTSILWTRWRLPE